MMNNKLLFVKTDSLVHLLGFMALYWETRGMVVDHEDHGSSVRYRGPIVWNLIPKAIKDASSLQLFKQKLRQASRILEQIQFEKEACQITSKQTDFLYF